jgi:hypothetical protein
MTKSDAVFRDAERASLVEPDEPNILDYRPKGYCAWCHSRLILGVCAVCFDYDPCETEDRNRELYREQFDAKAAFEAKLEREARKLRREVW